MQTSTKMHISDENVSQYLKEYTFFSPLENFQENLTT